MATKKKKTNPVKKKTRKSVDGQKKRGPRDSSAIASRNRRLRIEALIDENRAREYLRQWDLCEDNLDEIQEGFAKFDTLAKALKLSAAERLAMKDILMPAAEVRIKAIKEKITLNEKRLRKVFPDAKSVELTDPDGKNPFSSFADLFAQVMGSGS